MNGQYIWPDIFETGNIDGREDAALCADGLEAWGCCMAGSAPPESFGDVMVKIGVFPKPEKVRTPMQIKRDHNAMVKKFDAELA